MQVGKAKLVAVCFVLSVFGAMAFSLSVRQWLAAATAPVSPAISAVPAVASSEPILVEGSLPKVPPVDLTIEGKLVGLSAGASATVVVRVGNRTFNAQAQGAQYSAVINALSPNEMVTVDVTSDRVHYISVVGSFRRLTMRSGGDRRVTSAEHAGLQVSPSSTAVALLVNNVLGRDANTDAEFERASRSLASRSSIGASGMVADLATAAQTMHRIATGDLAMPAGHPDGLSFARDKAAYASYLGQNDAVASAAAAYPFAQQDFVPFKSLSVLPEALLLTSAWPTADLPGGFHGIQLFEKEADGRYVFHESHATFNVVGLLSIMRSQKYEASLTPAGEILFSAVDPVANEVYSSNAARQVYRTVYTRTFRQLTQGDDFSLWASETVWTESDLLYSAPPVERRQTEVWVAADLNRITQRNAWSGLSGRRALPWFCMQPLSERTDSAMTGCEFPQHRFDAGGTGVTEDVGYKIDQRMQPKPGTWGQSFNWSVDALGRLQIVAPQATTHFWNIDTGNAAANVVVYRARSTTGMPAGQGFAGIALAVSGDYLPLSSQQGIGRWEIAASLRKPLSYPTTPAQLLIERLSGGTANDYLGFGGVSDPPIAGAWQVVGERIFDTRYRAKYPNGSTKYVYGCDQAFAEGATGCSPNRVRYFRPLSRVGNRLYGIEEFYYLSPVFYAPPGYTGTFEFSRSVASGFFECREGACLSAFPTAMSQSATARLDSQRSARARRIPASAIRTSHADLRLRMRCLRP